MPPPYPAPAIRFPKPLPSPEECDDRVLAAIRQAVVGGGQPPDFARLATALDLHRADVCASFRRLAGSGAITLWPNTHSIRLVPPFTVGYGDVRVGAAVQAGGARGWWASGLWHALGIPAAMANSGMVLPEVVVRARDPMGGEPIALRLTGPTLTPEPNDPAGLQPVALLTVPFARWWNDPAAAIRALRLVAPGTEHAGTVVPLDRLCALALAWHADWPRDRPWSLAEARALVAGAGLGGPEWRLA